MTTDDPNFGLFDDLVFEAPHDLGERPLTTCLQLKHGQTTDGRTKPLVALDFNSVKGNFGLVKYCRDFVDDGRRGLILTNREVDEASTAELLVPRPRDDIHPILRIDHPYRVYALKSFKDSSFVQNFRLVAQYPDIEAIMNIFLAEVRQETGYLFDLECLKTFYLNRITEASNRPFLVSFNLENGRKLLDNFYKRSLESRISFRRPPTKPCELEYEPCREVEDFLGGEERAVCLESESVYLGEARTLQTVEGASRSALMVEAGFAQETLTAFRLLPEYDLMVLRCGRESVELCEEVVEIAEALQKKVIVICQEGKSLPNCSRRRQAVGFEELTPASQVALCAKKEIRFDKSEEKVSISDIFEGVYTPTEVGRLLSPKLLERLACGEEIDIDPNAPPTTEELDLDFELFRRAIIELLKNFGDKLKILPFLKKCEKEYKRAEKDVVNFATDAGKKCEKEYKRAEKDVVNFAKNKGKILERGFKKTIRKMM